MFEPPRRRWGKLRAEKAKQHHFFVAASRSMPTANAEHRRRRGRPREDALTPRTSPAPTLPEFGWPLGVRRKRCQKNWKAPRPETGRRGRRHALAHPAADTPAGARPAFFLERAPSDRSRRTCCRSGSCARRRRRSTRCS